MKYMGSKATLLRGPLGSLIEDEIENGAKRFVDLFAGAGSVSHFVAEKFATRVISVDVQYFSQALVGSVTCRVAPLSDSALVTDWAKEARDLCNLNPLWAVANRASRRASKTSVAEARRLCRRSNVGGHIFRHYGGHYFSPAQALALDSLHDLLPDDPSQRLVGMAAILRTASRCAAAPGHTAQPFQPTTNLLPFLTAAWSRDIFSVCQEQVALLCERHALVRGQVLTSDAAEAVTRVQEGDLVFLDPPYSAVQYSRFYHVLEGIARGGWDSVSGTGRAPCLASRFQSQYSLVSNALTAMTNLLALLKKRGVRVLITFPDVDASNGVSGRALVNVASSQGWRVSVNELDSVHSTLGGRSGAVEGRGARRRLSELAILLKP